MANLPTELELTGTEVTNAQQKLRFAAIRNFLADLFGTDSSNKSAARAALGVAEPNAGNLLINSNFAENAWGVSGTVTLASGAYGHERWKAGAAGCTYTFASSGGVTTLTIAAGSLIQVIEGEQLQSGTHILCWTGTAQAKIGAGSYGASGITASVTGGANLNIEFGAGTLSQPHFRRGSTALTWNQYSGIYGSEKQACLRYLPRATAIAGGFEAIGHGFSTSATQVRAQVVFMVPARVAPTGIAGVTDSHISANDGAATYINNATAIASLSSRTIGGVTLTVSGMTAFRPCSVYFNNSAGKILFTGCEL